MYVGSPADKAGLRAGDVIPVNGYRPGAGTSRDITVGTPNDVLKMSVRSVVDGKEHTILINCANR